MPYTLNFTSTKTDFEKSCTPTVVNPTTKPMAYCRYTVFCLHGKSCTVDNPMPRYTVFCLSGKRCRLYPTNNPMTYCRYTVFRLYGNIYTLIPMTNPKV